MQWIARKILELFGWHLVGEPPKVNKAVYIIAPHTSNWDFFIFLLVKWTWKIDVVFIGKHTIFVGPIGWFLRKIGGIPVNRDHPRGVIGGIVDEFEKRDRMIFALSPEGTRSYKDHWKSGFYRAATRADVPIQMCYMDKDKMELGFGPLLYPTGDREADLSKIRDFYQDKKGIKPELFSKITFKKQE